MNTSELEFHVLAYLAKDRSEQVHGWRIIQSINDMYPDMRLRATSVYRVLSRLERQGLIDCRQGIEADRVAGTLRKYYTLRDAGAGALLRARRNMLGMVRRLTQSLAYDEEGATPNGEVMLGRTGSDFLTAVAAIPLTSRAIINVTSYDGVTTTRRVMSLDEVQKLSVSSCDFFFAPRLGRAGCRTADGDWKEVDSQGLCGMTLRVLVALLRNPGAFQSAREIAAIVENPSYALRPNTLAARISRIRSFLGESAKSAHFVETLRVALGHGTPSVAYRWNASRTWMLA